MLPNMLLLEISVKILIGKKILTNVDCIIHSAATAHRMNEKKLGSINDYSLVNVHGNQATCRASC